MVQARAAHVQCQDHPPHKPEPRHRRGAPFDRDLLFDALLELQFLQHSGAWQQPAVSRHARSLEVAGVPAPIFMACEVTSSAPCLADVFVVCSFLFVTIWVAPENRARAMRTRGSTVLTQDSQGSQMVGLVKRSKGHQISCISRLSQGNRFICVASGVFFGVIRTIQ
jgi:hypothetical protein